MKSPQLFRFSLALAIFLFSYHGHSQVEFRPDSKEVEILAANKVQSRKITEFEQSPYWTVQTFNERGLLTEARFYHLDGDTDEITFSSTVFTYSSEGLLSQEDYFDRSTEIERGTAIRETSYEYLNGLLHYEVSRSYHDWAEPARWTDPDTIKYVYNDSRQLIERFDQGTDFRYEYDYSSEGLLTNRRMIEVGEPMIGHFYDEYLYDGAGQKIVETTTCDPVSLDMVSWKKMYTNWSYTVDGLLSKVVENFDDKDPQSTITNRYNKLRLLEEKSILNSQASNEGLPTVLRFTYTFFE
ncbi:MAG: hypothetical protein ACI837_000158 [Crocinitomicaceae bacterium]|jgi:hypothetical protein